MSITQRYAVIGNPIAHSRSPEIHAAFAQQFNIDLSYERILAPLGGFSDCVKEMRAVGFLGANVTVPFKLDAFAYADERSSAAQWAGAANTLVLGDRVLADNTDGFGIVRDIIHNLNTPLSGRRILLLGAGGAARGTLQALLLQKPKMIVVKNRSLDKAQAWLKDVQRTADFAEVLGDAHLMVRAWDDDAMDDFDVVINATASGLGDFFAPPSGVCFADKALAYDMMYGKVTPFLQWAIDNHALTADGWGMLVEQAAKSFSIWHGVTPDTSTLIANPPYKGA
ncbi:Shikimate dehydrogenase (NADP(+)) [Ephemeroptericola cinctiostellae]|uniref:Shikimate dehydrogenase (NADP(+)) n=1 Tax=Ephemeroptericola cinctiostellae TaxID=2268024 RepID=A0A345DAW0_9BURK|nr:shikimate dehydrogenase [Ephemeroptericola cinctiostellae]AXF85498.1 Shikimate dehydrogenase (NADP(+)) [Ephemeroptericola cinctiostellae]